MRNNFPKIISSITFKLILLRIRAHFFLYFEFSIDTWEYGKSSLIKIIGGVAIRKSYCLLRHAAPRPVI